MWRPRNKHTARREECYSVDASFVSEFAGSG